MHAGLAKLVDRGAIQLAQMAIWRLTKGSRPVGVAPIKDDDFFEETAVTAPELSFTTKTAFQFTSPFTAASVENNTVYGRLYRCGTDWQQRPAVILMHGWDCDFCYRFQFPLLARRLCRLGVNAAMLELPYHCHRRPRGENAVRDFISNDLESVREAIQQSIADIRALVRWMRTESCPSVGLWGSSLGGWLCGLVACTDDAADFAALVTPVGKISRATEELAFCGPIRQGLQRHKISLARLNLVAHHPRISPDKLLIVESKYDQFAPVETVEELWRAWGQCDIMRVNHGHISVLLSLPIMERVMKWISRAAQPAVGNGCGLSRRGLARLVGRTML